VPLNIFEPRYIAMIDDALAGDRVIGFIQPKLVQDEVESPPGKSVALRAAGGAGRLTAFQETDDGRYLVTLTGICRFLLKRELQLDKPYRVGEVTYDGFRNDLIKGYGEDKVDRDLLLSVLKIYLEHQNLKADWTAITRSSSEFLVNSLSMMSPYGPEEKQALLEAPDLKSRAEVLMALAKMQIATPGDGSGSAMQ
jgi:Lon protease-like protein